MRLDHIAYRVTDRNKTAEFFINAFKYKIQTEFDINFSDGSTAKCIALEPPEKKKPNMAWTFPGGFVTNENNSIKVNPLEYHLAPEIFVSDGSPDSIVGKWVAARGGIGGVHHMAYQVESVEEKMKEWQEKGYAEFSTEKPLTCPGLTQVFSKPSLLTGIIFEFIERGQHGFCLDNVHDLMLASKND